MTASAPKAPPLIVAHRGGSPGDVENSITAFENALAIGCDLIECDVRRSLDGHLVLWHDERVNGVKVNDLTVRELRRAIPTLLTFDDLLMSLAGRRLTGRLVIDLKERGIEGDLIPIFEQRPDIARQALVATVHTASLRHLAERLPNLRLALSRGHLVSWLESFGLHRPVAAVLRQLFPLWVLPQLRWSRARTVALQHHLLDRRQVKRYNRFGCRVYAWTVDDLPEAQRLADAGVHYIATNEPWDVLGVLGRWPQEE